MSTSVADELRGAVPQAAGQLCIDLRLMLARMELLPLVDAIAAKHGVTLLDLCGRRRTMRFARARSEVWHFLYHACEDLSYPDLGALFGRDHSTIRYGVLSHEERLRAQQLINQETLVP